MKKNDEGEWEWSDEEDDKVGGCDWLAKRGCDWSVELESENGLMRNMMKWVDGMSTKFVF